VRHIRTHYITQQHSCREIRPRGPYSCDVTLGLNAVTAIKRNYDTNVQVVSQSVLSC
jgi:hypothetical protein